MNECPRYPTARFGTDGKLRFWVNPLEDNMGDVESVVASFRGAGWTVDFSNGSGPDIGESVWFTITRGGA